MSRHATIKRIYGAAKAAGLDEETMRDRYARAVGKRSLKLCSDAELETIARDLAAAGGRAAEAGTRAASMRPQGRVRTAPDAHQRLAKSIWIGLWNLGALADGGDRALDAFVARQTEGRVLKLEWLTALDAPAVIEALKSWAGREGWNLGPILTFGRLEERPTSPAILQRERLLRVQWARAAGYKAVRIADEAALWQYVSRTARGAKRGTGQFEAHELDAASRAIGAMIRSTRAWRERGLTQEENDRGQHIEREAESARGEQADQAPASGHAPEPSEGSRGSAGRR